MRPGLNPGRFFWIADICCAEGAGKSKADPSLRRTSLRSLGMTPNELTRGANYEMGAKDGAPAALISVAK
jgi:hypothetical protein